MIETQQELTQDAVTRGYYPGTKVVTISGRVLVLTSWPWIEGEGEEQTAVVMARTEPDDPSSNQRWSYFSVMRRLSEPGAMEL